MPQRRCFRNWLNERAEDLRQAVQPALQVQFGKIPTPRFDSIGVDEDDVFQIVVANLMTHPKFKRRLFTFEEATRVCASFIRTTCMQLAKKQAFRNELGRKLNEETGLEEEAGD